MNTRERRDERWENLRGDGFRLVGWPSAKPSRTVLIIHHGLGEHAGRYDTIGNALHDMALHVWSYDARGHGESVGRRGDADGLSELAEDLETLIPVLLERSGCDRAILMGHSMGAAVVAYYLTTHEAHPSLDGVILSAPPCAIEKTWIIRIKIRIGRILARIAPRITMSNSIDSNLISSDPAQVERYEQDPLVHDRLSMGLGASLVDDAAQIPAQAGRIHLPILVYQGLADRIVLPSGTRRLVSGLGSVDQSYREFHDARHEVHHEKPAISAELFELLHDWIAPRLTLDSGD